MQILRAKVSDGGKYTCVAMNPAGEARRVISLTVLGQSSSSSELLLSHLTAYLTLHFLSFTG